MAGQEAILGTLYVFCERGLKKHRGSRCRSGHSLMTGARYPELATWEAIGSCGLSVRVWLRGASWEVWSQRHAEDAG